MKNSSLKKEDSLLDAVKAIEESPYRIVVVIDEDGTFNLAAFTNMMSSRTKIVSIPH